MEFLSIKDEMSYILRKNKLKKELEQLFTNANFIEVEPSFLEDYEQFVQLNKRVNAEDMVKVLTGDGSVSILRPDLTSVIIKNFIPKWEVGSTLKLFYQATVFENNKQRVINERKQAGVEILGGDKTSADKEILQLAITILANYEKDFILELGCSKYLSGLFKELNLASMKEKRLKELLQNKDEFGLHALVEKLNIAQQYKEVFEQILTFQGNLNDVLQKVLSLYMNEEMNEALQELQMINNVIKDIGYLEQTIYDLSMVTTFDYYEGIILKGYYPNVYQPIVSGGRYDLLTEMFGQRVPAVGFKVELSNLLHAIHRKGEL